MSDGPDLHRHVVLLHPDGSVRVLDASEFWADVHEGGGSMGHPHEVLVSVFSYDGDWPTAEVHPNGDEPVLLLQGAVTMLFDVDGEEQAAVAEAGAWCIVPQGVWHRALVDVPTLALHLTPGEGTQNRPAPAAPPDDPTPASVTLVDSVGTVVSLTDGVASTGTPGPQWHARLGGSATDHDGPVVLVDLASRGGSMVEPGGLPGLVGEASDQVLVLAHG